MIRRRNDRPSIRGISISSVITSGCKLRILSRATNGSGAEPTTSISGSADKASVRIFRTMAESSTIRTRVLRVLSIISDLAQDHGHATFFEFKIAPDSGRPEQRFWSHGLG